jgi:hypothetical protein
VFRLAPTHLGWDTQRQFTRRSRDPPGRNADTNIAGFNVSKCKKVPTPVKEEMVALLTKNSDAKEQKRKEKQRERYEIDLDNSGCDRSSEEESEHGNDVIVLKSTKGASSSRLATTGGTIDKILQT